LSLALGKVHPCTVLKVHRPTFIRSEDVVWCLWS